MKPLAVLADDLTGACDTGVQLSARGARVLVLASPEAALSEAALPEAALPEAAQPGTATPTGRAWDALVLNTESRHLPPGQAALRVAQAAQRLAAAGWPLRYKKIDSTLRGALAAELAALRPAATLVVCPAFPAAGRTVQRGVLCVAGVPVHESEIGRDRLNPVPESHLPTLLGSLGRVGQIGAVDLELGRPGVALRLGELRRQGAALVVCDASTDAHLEALAAALLSAWREDAAPLVAVGSAPLVAVGSAGLARALAAGLLPKPGAPAQPPRFPCPGPVLVLAGSRTAVTRAQVQALLGQPGVHSLVLDAAPLDAPDWDAHAGTWVAARTAELAEAARAGAEALLLTVAPGDAAAEEAARYALRSQRLNAALGALVAALAGRVALGGLVLTGGDIARAALAALGGEALQLGAEMLPGIPLGWPVGGAQPGLPVVTKAGGFGAPQALCEAVHFLRHGGAQSC